MWTAEHIWWYAGPLALLALFLARFKPLLGVVAIISSFFLNPGCGVWEMNSYLHGAVAEEMGSDYMLNAYFAIAAPPLFGIIGVVWHFLSRRGKSNVPGDPPSE
jgi:hypothetical protein